MAVAKIIGTVISEPAENPSSLLFAPGRDRLGFISGYVEEFIKFFENENNIREYAKILARWLLGNVLTYRESFLSHGQELEVDELILKYEDEYEEKPLVKNFAKMIYRTEHDDASGPREYNLPAYHLNNPLSQMLLHFAFEIEDYKNDCACYGSHYHIRYFHPKYWRIADDYRYVLRQAGIVLANHASSLLAYRPDTWATYYVEDNNYYYDDDDYDDYDYDRDYHICRIRWADPIVEPTSKYSAFYYNVQDDNLRTVENRLCENNSLACYMFAQIWHRYAGKLALLYKKNDPRKLDEQIRSMRPVWDDDFMSQFELPALQLPFTPVRLNLEYNDEKYPGQLFLEYVVGKETASRFVTTYIKLIDTVLGYMETKRFRLFRKDPKNMPVIAFI